MIKDLTDRECLPNRCPSMTIKVSARAGPTAHLTVQFDANRDCAPRGVFYSTGFRSGSEMEFLMNDACILISVLLKHGYTPNEILPKLSLIEQATGEDAQGSMIGLVVNALASISEEDQDDLRSIN